ncbi:hypothetical protein [Micromonospora sp. NBRC 110038]|uniref:hypothetical protein n=1 Tax=Micromonospora sp. NBRC 110038 TaxID=1550034 RepID=UPI001E604DEC|nr:hypothetical protein [Micromonospora sp. NBRC 110038]
MRLLGKAIDALTRCTACKGTGRIPHYVQGCNEVIDRHGRTVAHTDCTRMKHCDHCGGLGRTR